jgi:hypothetical protein
MTSSPANRSFCFFIADADNESKSPLGSNYLAISSPPRDFGCMSDSEFVDFVKRMVSKLHDALINNDLKTVSEICSGVSSQCEKIMENIRDDKESGIRGEIEKRPHDPDEYDTSEEEQSKYYEDEEEVLERVVVESEETFNERFPFSYDSLQELSRLSPQPKEQAIDFVTKFKLRIS